MRMQESPGQLQELFTATSPRLILQYYPSLGLSTVVHGAVVCLRHYIYIFQTCLKIVILRLGCKQLSLDVAEECGQQNASGTTPLIRLLHSLRIPNAMVREILLSHAYRHGKGPYSGGDMHKGSFTVVS